MLSLFNILEANYWAQVPQYTESLRLATCGQKDFMSWPLSLTVPQYLRISALWLLLYHLYYLILKINLYCGNYSDFTKEGIEVQRGYVTSHGQII